MCGVVARLSPNDPNFDSAVKWIRHRGIRATEVVGRFGRMAHARLPIVGLGEEYDQPVCSSPWTIGFVGEILDFKETHPHFRSDVELVCELWDDAFKSRDGFNYRDGFWGIVAINSDTGVLHILTDYLGQKPMYYRSDFPSAASEPGALLPFGPVSWDEVYFSAVRKWGYCPDLIRTPWNEIKHVLPGEHVRIHSQGYVTRRIVNSLVPVEMSEDALRIEIEKAVERRVMSSDVRVAALVSGGLDSSIVYALAAQYSTIMAYHTSSDGLNHSIEGEEDRARALVGDREFMIGDVKEVCSLTLHDSLVAMQEPIDLGSLTQQYLLAQMVEQRVCLTGDGADELFGGYSRSLRYDSQMSDIFHELPAWHLPRLDRIMMRRRIEVRSPFLARQVVQGAMGLPWHRRKNKIALREMFASLLPEEYLYAPKVPMKRPEVERNPDTYRDSLIQTFKLIFSNAAEHK